jgi:hypothetical protein
MNKIVREQYPASKLPDDLRGPLPPQALVRVTVESDETAVKSLKQIMQDIEAARSTGEWPSISTEEAVARIRASRDEWDD